MQQGSPVVVEKTTMATDTLPRYDSSSHHNWSDWTPQHRLVKNHPSSQACDSNSSSQCSNSSNNGSSSCNSSVSHSGSVSGEEERTVHTIMSVGDERKPKTRSEEEHKETINNDSAVEARLLLQPTRLQQQVQQQIIKSTATTTTATAAAIPKRKVRVGRVSCQWMYNQVQAARGLILIDTRPPDAYDEDTIPSAINIPPMANCYSLDDVEAGMPEEQRYLFSAKKRHLREVVLFGEVVKTVSSSTTIRSSRKETNVGQDSWLRYLERLIVQDGLVTSVKCLWDGFITFKYRYPFYTTSAMLDEISRGLTRTHSGTHNLNYPNEILEGFLFLGNMWHAQSKQVIKHLGITHVVNASLDVDDVFINDGVKYLGVKIKDKPDSDIAAYFDSTFAFIESAKRTQHGKVLVHCTQGISRSATLVIMYLMRAHNWSLVTAVNFSLASRGVVYPNEGFVRALMVEEFRLYNGNSMTIEEIDTLLQHQLPDRPLPLQIRNQKSENCSQCNKIFSLLEWKHKCSYCRKDFCSKCSSTRLANPDREKRMINIEDEGRPRRVCDCCVSRLWKINLPRSRKGIQGRYMQCKHLNVNSLSTFGRPVCISYFEGTDPQLVVDVIKTRFEVQSTQIIDISLENGEPVENLAELPDEAVVFVSIGKAGNVQDTKIKVQQQRSWQHHLQKALSSPKERAMRERSSSEGNMDGLQTQALQEADIPRTRSFQTETATSAPDTAVSDVMNAKFRELWQLSFPNMGMIEREDLLQICNPSILMDVMIIISSLSCGAMTLQNVNRRLVELGHTETDRQVVTKMLDKVLRVQR